jgi:beta-glucosidase
MLNKTKLMGGLAAVMTMFLALSVVTTNAAHKNGSTINTELGLSTFKVVENEDADPNEDTYYFKSSYGEMTYENQMKLYEDTVLQNINEMREGAALLYNQNNALPLASDERSVSVFGHASVDPVYRSSSAGNNPTATSYGTVTLDAALEMQGFSINEALWTALEEGDATRGEMRESFRGMTFQAHGSGKGNEEPIEFYEALES